MNLNEILEQLMYYPFQMFTDEQNNQRLTDAENAIKNRDEWTDITTETVVINENPKVNSLL